MIFQQNGGRESHANNQGKNIPGKGSRKCKSPEAKARSECAGFRTCIGAHGEPAGWSLEE